MELLIIFLAGLLFVGSRRAALCKLVEPYTLEHSGSDLSTLRIVICLLK
jgi:hypothetical protein